MKKTHRGCSDVRELNRALRNPSIPIVCANCGVALSEDDQKVAVDDRIYCKEDAFAAAIVAEPLLKETDFKMRFIFCKTKGLGEFYFYARAPSN
jgi:hypothetical protein